MKLEAPWSMKTGVWKEKKKLKQVRSKTTREIQICRAEIESLLRATYDIRSQIEIGERMQASVAQSWPMPSYGHWLHTDWRLDPNTYAYNVYDPYHYQSTFPLATCPAAAEVYVSTYPTWQSQSTLLVATDQEWPVNQSIASVISSDGIPPASAETWPALSEPNRDAPASSSQGEASSLATTPTQAPAADSRLTRRYSASAVDLLLYRFKTRESKYGHKRAQRSEPYATSSVWRDEVEEQLESDERSFGRFAMDSPCVLETR